jgi:hypothetical protein
MRHGERWDSGGLEDRPLGDLVGELARDSQQLLRDELRLAKAELRAEARKVAKGGAEVGAGGVALHAALLFLGITLMLIGATLMPAWLSALIVTVIYGAAGAFAVSKGRQDLAKADPKRVVDNLKEDERWAKETMHDIRSSRGASASAH